MYVQILYTLWHFNVVLLIIIVSCRYSFRTSIGAYGPLVDGPDYTFLDGRPTPLRKGQIKRAKAQQEVSVSFIHDFILVCLLP